MPAASAARSRTTSLTGGLVDAVGSALRRLSRGVPEAELPLAPAAPRTTGLFSAFRPGARSRSNSGSNEVAQHYGAVLAADAGQDDAFKWGMPAKD
jgi:hypothetical protein